MAGEIQAPYGTTAATLYAIVRNSVGQAYHTTNGFEAYQTANLASYKIALTEQGTASRVYVGTFPVISAGVYGVVVRVQAGGSPAESDVIVAAGNIEWGGTAASYVSGDTYARLGAPVGASISADLAAVQADLPQRITKNTALANFMFVMRNTAGTPTAGLTVTATRSLDGAAFGACANSVSEVGNGWYKIDLAAGDLNADVVALRFAATGAAATNLTIPTQPT